MSFKHIPLGAQEEFNVVVEIPKGSRIKYEYDEGLDAIGLDFIFEKGFGYMHNYGYIPETRGGDGDHLDALIFGDYGLAVGTIVVCRAIGMIELLDRGEEDNKILAVPVADRELARIKSIGGISETQRREFEKFFSEVGRQKKKTIAIKNFLDKDRAIEEIATAHKNYLK